MADGEGGLAGRGKTRPLRLLPRLDERNRPFWTGGERGELMFWRCGACGYYLHPPGPVCPECLSPGLAPEAVSGHGTLVSYTVNHQQWNPTVPAPYVIGLVELTEQPGLRLMTNLADCPSPAIGMPVRVVFERETVEGGDDIWVPLFVPGAVDAQG